MQCAEKITIFAARKQEKLLPLGKTPSWIGYVNVETRKARVYTEYTHTALRNVDFPMKTTTSSAAEQKPAATPELRKIPQWGVGRVRPEGKLSEIRGNLIFKNCSLGQNLRNKAKTEHVSDFGRLLNFFRPRQIVWAVYHLLLLAKQPNEIRPNSRTKFSQTAERNSAKLPNCKK